MARSSKHSRGKEIPGWKPQSCFSALSQIMWHALWFYAGKGWTASDVAQALYCIIVVKKDQNQKPNLSICNSPTLNLGQEFWKLLKEWGRGYKEPKWVSSREEQGSFSEKWMRSSSRAASPLWLKEPTEVVWACGYDASWTSLWKPPGLCDWARGRLGIPQEKLDSVTEEKDIWNTPWPPRPNARWKRWWMDGWMGVISSEYWLIKSLMDRKYQLLQ